MKKLLTILIIFVSYSLTQAQIISTFAGNGVAGNSGDGGPASAAELNFPEGTVMDAMGNIFSAQYYGNCIRKINTSGIISTVAGNTVAGFSGDGGPATAAEMNITPGVEVDSFGNIYIADKMNNRIRKVNTA